MVRSSALYFRDTEYLMVRSSQLIITAYVPRLLSWFDDQIIRKDLAIKCSFPYDVFSTGDEQDKQDEINPCHRKM